MFLDKTIHRNKELINVGFKLHQEQKIEPDSYVIDLDMLLKNASIIKKQADKNNVQLYFMLKQIGRNPYIGKELMKLGYHGAVVVDYREASLMMKHSIPIANVGHLVQPNLSNIQKLVDYDCDYFTVYSLSKIKDINQCALKSNKIVKLMIRVVGEDDLIYSGQTAGFKVNELPDLVKQCEQFKNVSISGVTSFPCFLYDEKSNDVQATNNMFTVLKAKQILEQLGCNIININTPSTTCELTLEKMAQYGATSGEPGHGLTGTTPIHATLNLSEKPCVIYVSEISHNYENSAYCFGGGHYRRSHLKNGLVGTSFDNSKQVILIPPTNESIDYHFEICENCIENSTVIMAFRFQMFVTRSDVVIVKGIDKNNIEIVGIYDSLGNLK